MKSKKEDKKESQINYYKISTFILVGIIVLIGLFFTIGYLNKNAYTQGVLDGQEAHMLAVAESINTKGQVSYKVGNKSLILVPAQYIQEAQTELIIEIFNQVEENGYVTLNNQDKQLNLVPYVAQK